MHKFKNILVIASHPDDEIFSMFNTRYFLVDLKSAKKIVF
jgi:LmbE family N-acetylglucosaminyl deacetylase